MRILHTNFRWASTGESQQMLVEEGRVVARGLKIEVPSGLAEIVDHGGAALLPSFIDNHCHILPTGLDLLKLHLGDAESHEDVLDLVSARHRECSEGWLLAVHYDQNRYEGGKHLTKTELDRISSDRPIMLRHVTGHAAVANSAALSAAGVGSATPDPPGGTFERFDDGTPSGVLLEQAMELVWKAIPCPTLEEMVTAILAAGDSMREWGIGCASDMQTGGFDLLRELEAYRIAAQHGCKVATRLYIQWGRMFGPKRPPKEQLDAAIGALGGTNCRVGGIKLFADGAIGSGTAAIYGAYADQVPTGSHSGTLLYKPEVLTKRVVKAAEEGYQVSIHAIGDYAIDLVMDAFDATGNPSRHRLEHAMLLSDSQINRLAKLDCHVTMQPEFLVRFGHTYRRQLGEARASGLLRFRSVIDAGLRLSFSSDRPITKGDPRDGLSLSTSRPEGFDPAENCSLAEAFEAYTTVAAKANEDADFGNLLPGSVADFQVGIKSES